MRLKGYDYSSPGAYFITLCAWNRECIFGGIINRGIKLNESGMIIHQEWKRSSEIRREIALDEFIIMPNHFHGIVVINDYGNSDRDVGANGRSPLHMQSRSLSSFIAGFKSTVTKSIIISRNTPGLPVWQRNYHDRVIRNDKELMEIRQYIRNNPLQWDIDEENPGNIL